MYQIAGSLLLWLGMSWWYCERGFPVLWNAKDKHTGRCSL